MSTAPKPEPHDHAAESLNRLELDDGLSLAYRAWAPARPSRRAVLLFHRGHEHSGGLRELVRGLGFEDRWVFSWDMRGHGLSGGRDDAASTIDRLVADAELFARALERRHGIRLEESAVIAHSLGAVVATAWVQDCAPPIRSLVLATPAFEIKLYVPFALPALRLWNRVRPGSCVSSFVKGRVLTSDPEQAREIDEDPLLEQSIPIELLSSTHRTARRLVRDAGCMRVPTLVLSAGSDAVVRAGVQRRFVERLSSPVRSHVRLPGFRHGVFRERERDRAAALCRDFVETCDGMARPTHARVIESEQARGSAELRRLREPLPVWHPKRLGFFLVRLVLSTVGRLSEGVRIGQTAGFDSGVTLDHVYRDEAHGRLVVGRWIDRAFLDAPGWRGIRERRRLMQAALDELLETEPDAAVLDVAAGPGRYLLEALGDHPEARAVLRDWSETNVQAAEASIDARGLRERARAERGDAFDEAQLAGLDPAPTIAIVSGLFELFPDDDLVRATLRGLARALPPGGRLVYTNQPRHPQLELIARSLRNHRGEAWVMRCRSQAEMDALVAEAGFEKTGTRATREGIFTVSVAVLRN